MIKYLILHIAGKLYFTSFNAKNHELQGFSNGDENDPDLSILLSAFCGKLTSNFEVYLFSDTITQHTVDLSKQALAGNVSLVEQFLLFELESVVDLLPDNPVVRFTKDKGSLYHCLLTDETLVNDLQNICLQYGGKLAFLGHPAGFVSSQNKNNAIEIFEETVHCQSLRGKCSFSLNSSLPTEYESVQKWLASKSLRNMAIYNLGGQEVIPLEGSMIHYDICSLNSKDRPA